MKAAARHPEPARGLVGLWAALPSRRFTTRPNYVWYVVGTVCVGAFMAALDASIVNVALPALQAYFGVNAAATSWVLIAYLLTLASLVTAVGRLADMVGRRPLYTLGFLVFIVGSALCGAAVSLPMLVGARVLQAAGAAMLQANSVAIITATMPPNLRGRAIGFQGSAQAVGLSIGPAVGGALIGLFGWRAIFYVNVPVGLLGTVMGALILPRDRLPASRQPFDWGGVLLFAPLLVAVMLALTMAPTWGFGAPALWALLAGAGVLLAFFVRRERRFRAPMIDLGLFRIRTMTIGNVTGLLSYSAMFGTLVLMPYFFKQVFRMPESEIGLLLTPVPLAMTIVAPVAGGLADRYGPRLLTVGGMAVTSLGCLLLALTVGPHAFIPFLVAELAIVGAGLGLFTPPNNSSVMGSAPPTHLGVAGGILNMARSLGMSWGTALALSLMGGVLALFGATTRHATPGEWVTAIRWAFVGLVVLGGLATGLSTMRSAGSGSSRTPSEPSVDLA
ncbi:MAG: MFS transporter [Actinomycetia bacterium]|nr:MFS transporter [Actinomycetes bacterium]